MTSIATSIRSALENQETLPSLPTTVSSWQVEAGPDATDEPAVWVWAILEEDVDAKTRAIVRESVRDSVLDFVRQETGSEVWVYVRFRANSEPA